MTGKQIDGQAQLEEVFIPKYSKDLVVYQENELIRSKKDDLTQFQSKLLRLCIAQIVKESNALLEYKVNIIELANLFNISERYIYETVDDETTDLMRKIIYIREKEKKKKDKDYTKINWVQKCQYKNGFVYIKLNEELKPYLLQLNSYFTNYVFEDALLLNTDNAIKLYELLCSWQNKRFTPRSCDTSYYNIQVQPNEVVLPLDFLKDYFNCENKYIDRDRDFCKRIIDANIQKINEVEMLNVTWRKHRVRIAPGQYEYYIIFTYSTRGGIS